MKGVIYQAAITDLVDNTTETYIGLTGDCFKNRISNHKKSFKHQCYKNETCLSNHIWRLKEDNHNYDIKWKIIDKGSTYDPNTNRCNLCTKEKFHIIYNSDSASLNSRNELWKNCIHRNRLLITNYRKVKPPDPAL